MTRNQRILRKIDVSKGVGLEIGPLAAAIVTKKEAGIKYLDHMSQEELRQKYKDEPVDPAKIPVMDYVLHDKSLAETIGKDRFDYVLASHVIEHIPNTVGWLSEIASILKPSGVLSLVIPDKRFTFDFNRRVSSPPEVIGAHYDKLQRFTSAMMYDFASECLADFETAEAWRDPEAIKRDTPKRWTDEEIRQKCIRNLDPNDYVDCHCFVYTPQSFANILSALMEQSLLDFEVAYFLETQENELEFYVSLRKTDKKKASLKKQLATLPELTPETDKVKEQEEQIAILQQEIHALTHSVSWKITGGLRKARQLKRKQDK